VFPGDRDDHGGALMEDVGFIVATYVAAFGAAVAMAWRVIRRGRDLARQLPDEDKPWT
jgi:hypothetical protein